MSFEIIPAIDVRNGGVVRLAQGDYGRETRFQASPLELAEQYSEAGARTLHLVDLDAARDGRYTLANLVSAVASRTSLEIQTGGGVREEQDVEAILAAGATRVVLGTVAVREPQKVVRWLDRFGRDRLTLALDTRMNASGDWTLPVRGWTEDAPASLDDLLRLYEGAGLVHVLCTDISRDGMLSGFNVELYGRLSAAFPSLRLQASGGVRDVADIRAARGAGARGAILGRALLEGRILLSEALAC